MVLRYQIPPAYVLDEMSAYEIMSIMEYSYYKERETWEQTRLLAYLLAQTHSSKKLKLTDIMEFEWELKAQMEQQYKGTTVTEEDVKELERLAEEWKKYL